MNGSGYTRFQLENLRTSLHLMEQRKIRCVSQSVYFLHGISTKKKTLKMAGKLSITAWKISFSK